MPQTAVALHNSIPAPRENLRSVSSDLQGNSQHHRHATPLPQLFSGSIRFFIPAKEYGFIETPDEGPDVFFYLTAVQKPYELSALKFPAKVEYEQVQTKRGPRASKVWLAGAK